MADTNEKPSEDAKSPTLGDESSPKEARKSSEKKHRYSQRRRTKSMDVDDAGDVRIKDDQNERRQKYPKDYKQSRRTKSVDVDDSGDVAIKDDKHRSSGGGKRSDKQKHRTRSMSTDESVDVELKDDSDEQRRKSRSRDGDNLKESRRSRKSRSRDRDDLNDSETPRETRRKSTSRDRDTLNDSKRESRQRKSTSRDRDSLEAPEPSSESKLSSSRHMADIEAKNRARAGRGSSKLDSSERREARRNQDDRDAKNRSRRTTSGAVKPGVQSVASSADVARTKSDRRSNRNDAASEAAPGVVAESRDAKPQSRRARKEQAQAGDNAFSRNAVAEIPKASEEDGTAVEAFAVNETDIAVPAPVDTHKQRQDAEAERQRLKTAQENERLRQQLEDKDIQTEKQKAKRQRLVCIACVLLILIGGGLGAFFATRSESSEAAAEVPVTITDTPVVSSTSPPTTAPIATFTAEPTDKPTEAIVYNAPSLEECEKLAAGEPLDGIENLPLQNFQVGMDVELSGIVDVETVKPELQSAIQQILMPEIAGCASTVVQRKLRRSDVQFRQLQSIRNVVASATFDLVVDDSASCSGDRSPPCYVLSLELAARLLGEERAFHVLLIISEVFGDGQDIRPKLQLESPFRSIRATLIESKDETSAPTTSPTESPSVRPSFAPVIGPTTAVPTRTPTTSPTLAPTKVATTTAPTKAATKSPTIPPTIVPFPGATPVPTKTPTSTPTFSPTQVPTKIPTRAPTTGTPTQDPTESPSKVPTVSPSIPPSLSPTVVASAIPTSAPTCAVTSPYIGCYTDDAERVMSLYLRFGSTVSVDSCAASCAALGYAYAGLQYFKVCFCGNEFDAIGPTDSSNCNFECCGECGGWYTASVYSTGVPPIAEEPLPSALYCGAFAETNPPTDVTISQGFEYSAQGCIRTCLANGYTFAALNGFGVGTCQCGNTAGTLGDDVDPLIDCLAFGTAACYEDASSCTCGGTYSNEVYRTTISEPCPNSYQGCFIDDADRVMSLFLRWGSTVTRNSCLESCTKLGYSFAGLEAGVECFCGNEYDSLGPSSNCNRDCGGECGGSLALSVYSTGILNAQEAPLPSGLYCGAYAETNPATDIELTQGYEYSTQGCIRTCLTNGYKFAGLHGEGVETCRCSNTAGAYGLFAGTSVACLRQGTAACYEDASSCNCGGVLGNEVYRTSTSEPCPL